MNNVHNFKTVLDIIKMITYAIVAILAIGGFLFAKETGNYVVGVTAWVSAFIIGISFILLSGIGYCAIQIAINTDPNHETKESKEAKSEAATASSH